MQGVFRRGLQLEALKEFILSQGASKNVTLQEWEKLWSINKRIIDPVCPRYDPYTCLAQPPQFARARAWPKPLGEVSMQSQSKATHCRNSFKEHWPVIIGCGSL